MNDLTFITEKNLLSAEKVKNILLEQDDKINKINMCLQTINSDITISNNLYNSMTSWFYWLIPLRIKNHFTQSITEIPLSESTNIQYKHSDDVINNLNMLKKSSIQIGAILDNQNNNLDIIKANMKYVVDKINK